MAHACNLSYLEVEIGRIEVQSQPGQIVHETPIFKISRVKWTGGGAPALQEQSSEFKPQSQTQKKK
jgi:hypothetical protein